ncbi:MAG: hypothetical protein GF317_04900 [Candidatus Lokiarchaeota archaeon]|nr:hypothetical protein [Candidatus Lokiarchaeota archaeon]
MGVAMVTKLIEKISNYISIVGKRSSSQITNIVLHHSLTNGGDANSFRKYHVNFLSWKAMAYDVVITQQGFLQMGERWFYEIADNAEQLKNIIQFYNNEIGIKNKALLMAGFVDHYKAAGEWRQNMNTKGMHICLVGNFDKYKPNDTQIKTLTIFLKVFCLSFFKLYNKKLIISMHRDFNKGKSCPGNKFPIERVKKLCSLE